MKKNILTFLLLLFLFEFQNTYSQIGSINISAFRSYSPTKKKDYDTILPVLVKFKIPDQFTVIQGSAGNKMAILEYRVGSGKWQKIVYKGSGTNNNKLQGKSNYLFENSLTPGVTNGSFVSADQIRFSISNGEPLAGPTVVYETLAAINQFGLSRCSAGGPVSMYFNSDSPINSVVWNSSGPQVIGTAGGGTTPFIYGRSGTAPSYTGPYTVVVSYSDGTTYTRVISSLFETVIPNTSVNAGVDQTRTTCASTYTFTISGTISGSPGTGIWSSPTGGIFGNASSLSTTYTFSAADISNGSAVLTLTSTGYMCNGSDQVVLRVPRPGLVSAGIDRTLCGSASVTLSGSRGGGATAATWIGGTGTFSNVNALNSNYTFSAAELAAGKVTLTLTATGSPCGNVSDQITLTYLPPFIFSITTPSSVYCGASAILTASSSTAGLVYTWMPQDGIGPILTGSSVTTPSLTTNKTYIVSVSSPGNPCPIPTQTVTIQVLNTPSIQVVGSSSVSCGQPYTLTINGTIPPSPPNTFQWKTSNTVVGTGSTFVATAPNNTSTTQSLIYSLVLNGNNACVSNNVSVTLTSCVQTCNNSNLSPKWATYFGGSGADQISEIAIKSNNNIVVLGNTNGVTKNLPTTGGTTIRDIGTSLGSGDGEIFLAEVSADGQNVLWINYIHTSAPENITGLAVDKSDNNVYLTIQQTDNFLGSYTYNYIGTGLTQNSLFKFDNTGALTWSKKYLITGTMQTITSGNDGYLYIAGSALGISGSSPNRADLPAVLNGGLLSQQSFVSGDMFVMKVDKLTATDVWSRLVDYYTITSTPNPCSQSTQSASKIVWDNSGNTYVCGAQSLNSCVGGGFFSKGVAYAINQNGNVNWAKLYNGTNNFDQYTSICVDQGTLALVGLQNAIGFGPNGLIGSDIYLERLTISTGASMATRVIGGADSDVQYSIVADGYGKVYVTGYTASNNILASFASVNAAVTAYHSAHTSYRPLAPNPTLSQDIFVGRFYNTNFIPDWFTYYGSASTVKSNQNNDIGYGLAVDNGGNIYVVGVTASRDFETGTPLQNLPNFGSTEGAIIKFGCTSGLRVGAFMADLNAEETEFNSSANATFSYSSHPNPFSNSVLLTLPESEFFKMELIDSKGILVYEQSEVVNQTEVNLSNLKAGLYQMRLSNSLGNTYLKLVKSE